MKKPAIRSFLPFLPLTIFIISHRFTQSWKMAFIIAGTISAANAIISFKKNIKTDPFLMGINYFLIGGLVMNVLNIKFLQFIYGKFVYATLFISIFLVGLFLTFYSPEGFIGSVVENKKTTRKLSLILATVSFISIIFSWYFIGDYYKAAWIPFVSLLFFRDTLISFFKEEYIKNFAILLAEFFLIINLSFFARGMGWTFFAVLLILRKVVRHYVLGLKTE